MKQEMNMIYSDNTKHSPVDINNVIYMWIDNDRDLKFRFKNKDEIYWLFKDKGEGRKMQLKILGHINASNMSTQIKLS